MKNEKSSLATAKLIITTPAKAGDYLISLDRAKHYKYNYNNDELNNTHRLLLLGHRFVPQGAKLWHTPREIVADSFAKLRFVLFLKCFIALICLIPNLSYANPIDTMNEKINEFNNLNTEQNTKLNQSINAKANTLTQKSKSLFLLKQNNELLMLEHKIQALQDTKD